MARSFDEPQDPRAAFDEASVGHGSLERAQAILAAHPELASADIHTAAVLGDDRALRLLLARDPSNATAKGGTRGWDALTHLCFSRYLRLDPARSQGFVRAARALLEAGASATTGYHEPGHEPQPEWESALYGAAGLAHHAELTALLLEHGADPNDGETVYHAPETHDNAALAVLVRSGRLSPDSLASMLLRKADWHDLEGVRLLLEHGADPNRPTRWGFTALHQALRRDNALAVVELMLAHGADPRVESRGSPRDGRRQDALALAACRGRADVLALFERSGVPLELAGSLRLIAACARDDDAGVRSIARAEPGLLGEVLSEAGRLLAGFAGVGNTAGVRHLLGLGADVNARYDEDDGYWQIGAGSTALHVAAWRARHATVRLLIDRGASIDARDASGRTPLGLAVRACVDSHWSELRAPDSVALLLAAGASPGGAVYPSGYPEVDDLLAAALG